MGSNGKTRRGPAACESRQLPPLINVETRVADRRRKDKPRGAYQGNERRVAERRNTAGQAFLWNWLNSAQR